MSRPFENLRVLDLTHVLAGPFCTYQLGVLGADVIKIEPVDVPDISRGRGPDDARNAAGMGLTYQAQASNKRCIALDLATDGGAAVMRKLVAGADVFVENYRVGALAQHGFGYDDVAALKADIIYCSLTGYGQTGPRASVNAYDNVIQANSGIMDRTGGVKTAASYVDYVSGMNAAMAISAALYRRQRDGKGVHIDCAMMDSALMMVSPEIAGHLSAEAAEARPAEAGIACYDTADGRLMLAAFNFRQNRRLWQVLGVPEFQNFSSWPELWAAADAMRAVLTEKMRERTADEWMEIFREAGIPAERVRSLSDALADPQLEHRDMAVAVTSETGGSVRVPVAAFKYSEDGPALTRPPSRFGEHTDEVLGALGYSDDDIAALRAEGAIA